MFLFSDSSHFLLPILLQLPMLAWRDLVIQRTARLLKATSSQSMWPWFWGDRGTVVYADPTNPRRVPPPNPSSGEPIMALLREPAKLGFWQDRDVNPSARCVTVPKYKLPVSRSVTLAMSHGSSLHSLHSLFWHNFINASFIDTPNMPLHYFISICWHHTIRLFPRYSDVTVQSDLWYKVFRECKLSCENLYWPIIASKCWWVCIWMLTFTFWDLASWNLKQEDRVYHLCFFPNWLGHINPLDLLQHSRSHTISFPDCCQTHS